MGITLLKYLSSEKAEVYPHCIKYLVSPNFMVWQFCGKVQVPHSFWRIDRNSAEIVPFHKCPHGKIRWNYGILRSACILDFSPIKDIWTFRIVRQNCQKCFWKQSPEVFCKKSVRKILAKYTEKHRNFTEPLRVTFSMFPKIVFNSDYGLPMICYEKKTFYF